MGVLKKIFAGLVVVAALYLGLLVVERMTTQELTSVAQGNETVCLMWKPQFLTGNGLCFLNLKGASGQVVSTARVGMLDTAFNALQQYGQLEFQGEAVKVSNLKTGEVMRRFTVKDGALNEAE